MADNSHSPDEVVSNITQEVEDLISSLRGMKESPIEIPDARSFQQLEDDVHLKCAELADKIVAINLQQQLSGKKK